MTYNEELNQPVQVLDKHVEHLVIGLQASGKAHGDSEKLVLAGAFLAYERLWELPGNCTI